MLDEQALLNLAESACNNAKLAGAGEAEAYLSYNKEFSAEVREGKTETIKVALDQGLGLRVVKNGKVGFAYTSDLEKASLKNIADQAIANARETAADPYRIFPSPSPLYPELDLYDSAVIKTPVETKIDLAKAMEEAARAFDPRIKIIESSNYQDIDACVILVNSKGIKNSYRATYCGVNLSLVAGEGEDQQTGFAMDYRLRFDDLNAEKIGREAAFRAVRMLGAKPVSTRETAVLFDPYVAAGFLDLLGPALTAEAVQKGRSFFIGKVNQPVAALTLNIIDDGIMPGGIASAPFDGEGVQMSRKTLIEGGVLKGYLHNTYTAAKENGASTGNCMRSSYKSAPDVGTTNFYIQPGVYAPDELINSTGNGIYITEVIGMHTANPISGDFSVGAAGILIENGQLTKPVRGIAIAGNIQEVLQQVDGIGSDLIFFGSQGSPTLRIARMIVSGH